jgi:hypothetical protein
MKFEKTAGMVDLRHGIFREIHDVGQDRYCARDDDDEVQPVQGIAQIRMLMHEEAPGNDFDDHFNQEDGREGDLADPQDLLGALLPSAIYTHCRYFGMPQCQGALLFPVRSDEECLRTDENMKILVGSVTILGPSAC